MFVQSAKMSIILFLGPRISYRQKYCMQIEPGVHIDYAYTVVKWRPASTTLNLTNGTNILNSRQVETQSTLILFKRLFFIICTCISLCVLVLLLLLVLLEISDEQLTAVMTLVH